MRYCVDIYGVSKASFDTLDKARRYCIGKVSDGNRGYIYTGWEPDSKTVGVVAKDISGYRYHSKGKSWKLAFDGSIIPNKKKKIGPFGL